MDKVNTSVNLTDDSSAEQLPPVKEVTFQVEDDCLRKVVIKEGPEREIRVYHIYPRLGNWLGKVVSDEVNPRSHDDQALRSPVARAIESTIRENPEDFFLSNRGVTILADELHYDKERGMVRITTRDPLLNGVADGGTTDAVLAKVQRSLPTELGGAEAAKLLSRGRIHLEVILGVGLKERIDKMVEGRNTSRQVKAWTISDFKGSFDWIEKILESNTSPFKAKVGYEENAGKAVNVLDVLSLLTLFHQEFDSKGGAEKRRAPTVAYSSKGRMDSRLNDPVHQSGYIALSNLLVDILRLYDYIYVKFESAYRESRDGKSKLGRRRGFEAKPHQLYMTGETAEYMIPSGVLYPLMASLRALLKYDKKTGQAQWSTDPFAFFDKNGAELVGALFEQLDLFGGDPQTAGKKKPVYTALHDRARLLLSDDN